MGTKSNLTPFTEEFQSDISTEQKPSGLHEYIANKQESSSFTKPIYQDCTWKHLAVYEVMTTLRIAPPPDPNATTQQYENALKELEAKLKEELERSAEFSDIKALDKEVSVYAYLKS